MVAPLPVREFSTAAEMLAHYAAVQARCFAPTNRPAAPAPAVTLTPAVAPIAAPVPIPPAGKPRTLRQIAKDRADDARRVRAIRAAARTAALAAASAEQIAARAAADRAQAEEDARRSEERRLLPTRFRRLLAQVCDMTGIGSDAIVQDGRTVPVVKARHIYLALCVWHLRVSMKHAGERCGGRDHTMVLSALRRVDAALEANGLSRDSDPADVIVRLWQADWPKPERRP